MDNISNQKMENLITKKQLSVFLAGSIQCYENYKKTQQIKSLYPNDFHYYNDTFYVRHERNTQEVYKIRQLINKGILKPEMLLYNNWNAFYPSYVLNHHFSIYLEILTMINKQTNDKVTKDLLERGKQTIQLGCYCQKIISTQFGSDTNDYEPSINKGGEIQMDEKYFFLDKHVSLYYHVVCFIAKYQSQKVLVFVKIRNQHGQINKQIQIKDFGERISSEYLQVGFNFNKVKPFLVVKLQNQMKVKFINNLSYFSEFNLSLLDLRKSLSLAIKYTKMRKQFKTIPNITYQAVGKRIVDAFSKLVCFSELNKALLNNKHIIPFVSPLLDINHHYILQNVIRLRQCCGGFGYLQAAGHAGCIQRLTLRASEACVSQIPQNKQILKRLHFYSSSEDMQSYVGEVLNKENILKQSQIFSVFVIVCVNMRKVSDKLRKQIYLRHFMWQSGIQILRTVEQFSKCDKKSIWFMALHYSCAEYILQNSEYINWAYIDKHMKRQKYLRGLLEFRNNYLNKLISKIGEIEEILEVNHVRNAIVGRQNEKQFYDEVLQVSRKNLRNSEQFVEYVRRPIVQFLAQNNAKL